MSTPIHSCTYSGRRLFDGQRAVGYQISVAGRPWSSGPLVPQPLFEFDWGRDGESAVHLAFAILHHVTNDNAIAQQFRFRFATKVVATWGDTWSIESDFVLGWLVALGNEPARKLLERTRVAKPPEPAQACLGDKLTGEVFRGATRTYRGSRKGELKDQPEVIVTHVAGEEVAVYPLALETSLRIRPLSPGGFNWGYRGAACSQLALAILLDATDRMAVSTRSFSLFADQFVSKWGDRWEITSPEILGWLASIGAFLPSIGEEVAHG